MECDASGSVHPRAVTFESPSDVLRSGGYYIAKQDVRRLQLHHQAGGPPSLLLPPPRNVTFRSRILVKEFEMETLDGTPKSGETPPHPHRLSTSNTPSDPNVSFSLLSSRNANHAEEEAALEKYQRRKRERTDTTKKGSPPPVRFVPFMIDMDGSGQKTLLTFEMIQKWSAPKEIKARKEAFEKRHALAESVIRSAKDLVSGACFA